MTTPVLVVETLVQQFKKEFVLSTWIYVTHASKLGVNALVQLEPIPLLILTTHNLVKFYHAHLDLSNLIQIVLTVLLVMNLATDVLDQLMKIVMSVTLMDFAIILVNVLIPAFSNVSQVYSRYLMKNVSTVLRFVHYICGAIQQLENVNIVQVDVLTVPVMKFVKLHVMRDIVSTLIYVNLLTSNAHPVPTKFKLMLPVVLIALLNVTTVLKALSVTTSITFVTQIVTDLSLTNNV